MASAGGGSAYIRLEKPDNAISQGLQYWGGIAAQQGAETRARNEREANRKRKELQDWGTKYDLKPEDFQSKYTGFKSFDDMNTEFSQYSVDKYVDLNRQARQALENGNLREKTRLEGEMIKLKNDFDLATQSQEFFSGEFEKYKEAAQAGTISGSSQEYEDIVQEAFLNKNIAIRHDEEGNMIYTGIRKDENGEQIPFEIPFQDLMDGSFTWNEKQQISGEGGLVDGVLNDLGTISTQREDGLFSITEQAWDEKIHGKAADQAIEAYTGNASVMGDLLYQLSGGEVVKMRGFTDEDYKTVQDGMKKLIRAGYDEKFSRKFDAGRAANQRGWAALNKKDQKPKSKKEQELGVRRWNIDQVRDNNDVSFFNAGDFKWQGKEHEAINAEMVGDKVVVTTSKGKKISVPKNNETAMNDLFNAFEGTKTKFDDVQTVQPLNWREERQGELTDITNAVDRQYSPDGKYIGDDDDFAESLQKIYPDADISTPFSFSEKITVNGTDIDLSQTRQEVERDLVKALGVNPISASNPPTGNAGGDVMSDDDYEQFLLQNGLK